MPSAVQQQRMEIDQLRREASMKRIPVSQAVEDIKVVTVQLLLFTCTGWNRIVVESSVDECDVVKVCMDGREKWQLHRAVLRPLTIRALVPPCTSLDDLGVRTSLGYPTPTPFQQQMELCTADESQLCVRTRLLHSAVILKAALLCQWVIICL